MSSMEDGKNGFKKGKPPGSDTDLFGRLVGDEPKTVTISEEGFKKLLYAYAQLHGMAGEEVENVIIEGGKSGNNGDVYLAKLKHAYAKMCNERGSVPRGYTG